MWAGRSPRRAVGGWLGAHWPRPAPCRGHQPWAGPGDRLARGRPAGRPWLGSVPTTCAGVRGTAGSPPALGPPSEPQWPLQTEVAEPRPLCQAPSSDQGPGWPWLDRASPRQVHSVGTVSETQGPHGHGALGFPVATLPSVAPAVPRGHLVCEAGGGQRGPCAPWGGWCQIGTHV